MSEHQTFRPSYSVHRRSIGDPKDTQSSEYKK
jgi:hypothetical protein